MPCLGAYFCPSAQDTEALIDACLAVKETVLLGIGVQSAEWALKWMMRESKRLWYLVAVVYTQPLMPGQTTLAWLSVIRGTENGGPGMEHKVLSVW